MRSLLALALAAPAVAFTPAGGDRKIVLGARSEGLPQGPRLREACSCSDFGGGDDKRAEEPKAEEEAEEAEEAEAASE